MEGDLTTENQLGGMSSVVGEGGMSPVLKTAQGKAKAASPLTAGRLRFRVEYAEQLVALLNIHIRHVVSASQHAEDSALLRRRLEQLEEGALSVLNFSEQLRLLLVEHDAGAVSASQLPFASDTAGKTVLLVRGEEDMTLLLRRMLDALGCLVVESDTADAMEQLAGGRFAADLVLMDHILQGGGLIELLQRLGDLRPEQPILLCSACVCARDMARSLLGGLQLIEILQKPFTLRELAQGIALALASGQKRTG